MVDLRKRLPTVFPKTLCDDGVRGEFPKEDPTVRWQPPREVSEGGLRGESPRGVSEGIFHERFPGEKPRGRLPIPEEDFRERFPRKFPEKVPREIGKMAVAPSDCVEMSIVVVVRSLRGESPGSSFSEATALEEVAAQERRLSRMFTVSRGRAGFLEEEQVPSRKIPEKDARERFPRKIPEKDSPGRYPKHFGPLSRETSECHAVAVFLKAMSAHKGQLVNSLSAGRGVESKSS